MRDHDTHPDILLWIPRYIATQGNRLFVDMPDRYKDKMTQEMRQVGNTLDRIGWRNFTEGKVSTRLLQMQQEHLRGAWLRRTLIYHAHAMDLSEPHQASQNKRDAGAGFQGPDSTGD